MMPHRFVAALVLACALVAVPASAEAQVDCWAPREAEDSVSTPRFTPIRQTLLTLEDIIRRNAAYQAPPEPVRMRTTIAAGPSEDGGARIFVRAYPPVQTTADIRIWTKDRCDVIPQAERVAASVGQVYVFVNYNVQEQFLQGTEVPTYEGEFAGYPIYNGWIVMTRDRRLPWIPQTLGDRIDREEQKRKRALDDWNAVKAGRTPLDEAAQMKTYELLKRTDPAGAEKFLATMREVGEQTRKAQAAEPLTHAHLQRQLQAVRDYRATFTAAQLAAPAVWMDPDKEGRKRLDAQVAAYRRLSPEDQQQVDALGRESRDLERQARAEKDPAAAAQLRERARPLVAKARAVQQAHAERASFLIRDALAAYDLTNLRPGDPAHAMAFKPDPSFPDLRDPFRPQLIMVNFWSKSNPKDLTSPRTQWLRRARETFDLAAVAALLR